MNCSTDWFHQAQADLQQASLSAESGFHEWACFACHQAVEKAPKSLRKNRLSSRCFSSGELIALRLGWSAAFQRLRTRDFKRFALFRLAERGHLATPLGNPLFMPLPWPA